MVLKRGGVLAAIGVAVGLIGVFATTRVTASMDSRIEGHQGRSVDGTAVAVSHTVTLLLPSPRCGCHRRQTREELER